MADRLHERLLLDLLRDRRPAAHDVRRVQPEAWLDLLRRHRLAGLIGRRLAASPAGWPRAVLDGVAALRRKTLADNMVLIQALHDVSAIFADLELPFVVLKGASLGEIHPDLDLRPMTDLDLLIRREDWPLLARTLRRRGYRLPSQEQESFYRATWYHQLVETAGFPSCWIELHWNIESAERSGVDPAGLMERAVSLDVDGHAYRRLCDDDLFLHLAVHLAHHFHEPSLHWVEDIHLLLQEGRFDWHAVARRAERWRVRNSVAYAFAWVEHVHPGSLPDPARGFVLSAERRALLRSLATDDPMLLHAPLADRRARHVVSMLLLDRWRDAAAYIARHAALRVGRRLGLSRRAPGEG